MFLGVWTHANRFTSELGSARSWMLTVARRRAIDRVRASQASRYRDQRVGIRDWVSPFDTVTEIVDVRDDLERLHRAMSRLPVHENQLVGLVHLDGFSHVEVAERLGVAPGTVKSRLHYAMRALRAAAAEI